MAEKEFDASYLEPPLSNNPPPRTPQVNAETSAKLKKLEEYFGKEGYEVAVSMGSGEKRRLNEKEMMFLVS